jgi:hypothetical protein
MEKQLKQLLEYFSKLNFVDILAFGNILGIEEQDNFEDYVTEILMGFQEESRFKRKKLLKLAKDVAAANKDIIKGIEKEE